MLGETQKKTKQAKRQQQQCSTPKTLIFVFKEYRIESDASSFHPPILYSIAS